MNRILLVGLMALVSANAHARADVSVCDAPEEAKRRSLSLEGDMASYRDEHRKQEVELENQITAAANALVTDKLWTEDQRIAFFKNLMTDPAFLADEDSKKARLAVFMTHAKTFEDSLGKQQYKQSCLSTLLMMEQLEGVSATNIKQYQYMLDALKTARSAKS